VEDHVDEIALVQADLQPGAETLLISYGVTAQAARQAVRAARQAGRRLSLLVVHSLWPVPEDQIRAAMEGTGRILVPELNLGQYSREIERLARGRQVVTGIQRVDGERITPRQILEEGGLL
jgi:2-oxoglutarate/2-oxoacid ferredoxin oxidoreductase subunit alpha